MWENMGEKPAVSVPTLKNLPLSSLMTRQQILQVVIRNLFFNNYKEQNISKAYSYVTSTVQGSDGMCFTLNDSVTRANKKKKEN